MAQKTRIEIMKPTTPDDDAKPNSPAVPDVIASLGKSDRVVVLRFKYQTDLLKGLEDAVRKYDIRNAAILSAAGSVRDYHIHVVGNRTFPSKNVFVKDTETPADILGMNGYVIDGRVHAHITLADADRAFGGHLEPDTHVFTFAIVTLVVFSDSVNLNRFDDKTYR